MLDSLPRVLLADDHLLFAKSLERLLEDDVEVVGTVGDGETLLAAADAERPDVIVCDISMPEPNGLEATRLLADRDPEVKVVMLSMHADAAHVKAAFRAGAQGYVTKSAAPEELLTAIREVAEGNSYISPSVTGEFLRSLVDRATDGGGSSEPASRPTLSRRKREVVRLISRGYSNARIAERLCISEATVRSHLSHLYAKLKVGNRVELALYAVEAGWAHPGEDPTGPV